MSKKKHLDENEQLKNRIRDLEQTNKTLRRRLKKLEQLTEQKDDLMLEQEIKEIEDQLTEELPHTKKEELQACADCGSPLSIVKMANRVFYRCNKHPHCRYRTKATIED